MKTINLSAAHLECVLLVVVSVVDFVFVSSDSILFLFHSTLGCLTCASSGHHIIFRVVFFSFVLGLRGVYGQQLILTLFTSALHSNRYTFQRIAAAVCCLLPTLGADSDESERATEGLDNLLEISIRNMFWWQNLPKITYHISMWTPNVRTKIQWLNTINSNWPIRTTYKMRLLLLLLRVGDSFLLFRPFSSLYQRSHKERLPSVNIVFENRTRDVQWHLTVQNFFRTRNKTHTKCARTLQKRTNDSVQSLKFN